MAKKIWVNFGSGNGLLPDGTRRIQELILTYNQQGPVQALEISGSKTRLNNAFEKSHPALPGTIQLIKSSDAGK